MTVLESRLSHPVLSLIGNVQSYTEYLGPIQVPASAYNPTTQMLHEEYHRSEIVMSGGSSSSSNGGGEVGDDPNG